MLLSLSISGHTIVMESPKLDPRVKLFESFSSLNALTLGPRLGDTITNVRPEIERLSDIYAATPFTMDFLKNKAPYFLLLTTAYRMTRVGQTRLPELGTLDGTNGLRPQ